MTDSNPYVEARELEDLVRVVQKRILDNIMVLSKDPSYDTDTILKLANAYSVVRSGRPQDESK